MIEQDSGGAVSDSSNRPSSSAASCSSSLTVNKQRQSTSEASTLDSDSAVVAAASIGIDGARGGSEMLLSSESNAGESSSNIDKEEEENSSQTTNVEESGDESSNDPGKMFIGGLSWQTSAEGLRDYFCKFGEVNECMVMRDPQTKRARGFGFITFVDPSSVEKVLAEETHDLDGKKIDPKVAFPKRTQPKMIVKTKKVFIGGLSASSTIDDIKAYFQQFGKIEDAMLMFDKSTQRHRGFGFITFDDDEVSDKVCEIHFHEINGKMVECKKAQPKEVMLPVQLNKSRAAAARNLYGLAPEQLLAYASYMPRVPPYAGGGVPPLYPGIFNGFSQSYEMSPSGRSSTNSHHNGSNNGLLNNGGASSSSLMNARELAAVQMAAQQQAVYDAAIAYAAGAMGGGGNFAAAAANAFHPPPLGHHHMQPPPSHHLHHQHQQQHQQLPNHHPQQTPQQQPQSLASSYNSNKM